MELREFAEDHKIYRQETLTDLASGMGKGIDQQMAIELEMSQEMLDMGITKTIAKNLGITSRGGKGITVYLKSEKAIEAQLVAKAVNKDDLELGRSTVDVKMGNDDGQYIKFIFDNEMDTQLVKKYIKDKTYQVWMAMSVVQYSI